MTAVDHAELKRLAEGAISSRGKLGPQIEAERTFHIAANPAVVLNLLSEIEGLKAERDALKAAWMAKHQAAAASEREARKWFEASQDGCMALAEEVALRTQAPDSWRPDREAVRKAVLAMEATIVWDRERGYRMPYRVRDPLYEACDAILALRPQTAESGK